MIFVGQPDGFEKRGLSRIDTRAWTLCRQPCTPSLHGGPESHAAHHHASASRSHSSILFATERHRGNRLGFSCQCCAGLEYGLVELMPPTITIPPVAFLTPLSPKFRPLCNSGILLVMSPIFVTPNACRKTLHIRGHSLTKLPHPLDATRLSISPYALCRMFRVCHTSYSIRAMASLRKESTSNRH